MKRPLFIGRLTLLVLACAACGGGAKHSAAAKSGLPSRLVQQIKAEIRKPSVIGGAAAATTAEVYGPASYAAIDRAWEGKGAGAMTQVSGHWYLIVLHGHFQWNGSLPPGASAASLHRNIALVAWSPNSKSLGQPGTGYTMARRVPRAVSRLGAPAAISLS
jgi:hypothetical protein